MAIVGLCLALLGRAAAQSGGSLKNLDTEKMRPAIDAEALSLENTALKQRLAESENVLKSLQQSFGSVSNEAEVFRRKSAELNTRIESLGVASIDSRLIKLLNELRVGASECTKLRDALMELTEAAARYQKHANKDSSDVKAALDSAIRESTDVLGANAKNPPDDSPNPPRITDSVVISVKDELALIVANVGTRQGVRLGMPFEVVRGDAVIGAIRVVDVRDKISGALVQNLSQNETIKVGDRLKVIGH